MTETNQPTENRKIPPVYAHIKGWGIDANPKNEPTYPLRQRVEGEHDGYTWERPAQQEVDSEVYHSIERPNLAATFGTSVPPRGLSGVIRRAAFRKSENEYAHWLPLLLADRINMVEGVLDDLSHGFLPNLYHERGLRADWEYDRQNLVAKVAVGAGVAALLTYLVRQRSTSDHYQ